MVSCPTFWHDMPMSHDSPSHPPKGLVAAIDIGSNAMRLGIATCDEQGTPQLIHRYREPVRLGHDAFTSGVFSQHTMQDARAAFQHFRRILDQYHITHYRAVATSAMRDTSNSDELIQSIQQESDIQIELISGEEEARLVHYSIAQRVDLFHRFVLLVDMGGGSVEVTLCDDGEVIAAQSFKLGTVRLLELLGQSDDFNELLSNYMSGVRRKIKEQLGHRKASMCIATGGNAGALGQLVHQQLNSDSPTQLHRKQLKKLIHILEPLSPQERMQRFDLRPDRADVILPAAMVFHEIMKLAKTKHMTMPDASLLDGVLLDMMDNERSSKHARQHNLLAITRHISKRFHVDRSHADKVATLALSLFDQCEHLHHLSEHDRLLLHIAARLHEIGMYIRVGGHHRHAAYIISTSSLLGLSAHDKAVLAQTVRYQRKAFPNASEHPDFAQLSPSHQQRVRYLSAFLRLAIALNKERRKRVHDIQVQCQDDDMTLHITGKGDLLLEIWSAMKVSEYIRVVFGMNLHIQHTHTSSCASTIQPSSS